MAIAPNDVNVLSAETADLDFAAGQNIDVTIEAEAGVALHGTGGKYRVRMTMTDTTNPALLNQQDIVEPRARVISNADAPLDTSHAVGASVLLTP